MNQLHDSTTYFILKEVQEFNHFTCSPPHVAGPEGRKSLPPLGRVCTRRDTRTPCPPQTDSSGSCRPSEHKNDIFILKFNEKKIKLNTKIKLVLKLIN